MCIASTCVAFLFAAPVSALAQTSQPMSYSNARSLPATNPLAVIWRSEIQSQNAFVRADKDLQKTLAANENAALSIISKEFPLDGETLIVSIASTRSCEGAANNFASNIEPEICEVKIARLKNGKLINVQKATGCYIDHSDSDLPAQNRDDDTFVAFDRERGVLQLQTRVGGKMLPACQRSITLK